jgi:hypothetical protein
MSLPPACHVFPVRAPPFGPDVTSPVPDVMVGAGAGFDKRPVRGGFCGAIAPSRWGPQPGRGTVADGGAAGVGAMGFDDFMCKTPFLSFRDGTRTCSGARQPRRLTVWHWRSEARAGRK